MKNTKKKLVVICLALVLTIVAAVGTSLAYFTDTENAENVMIVGNVKITQDETFNGTVKLIPAVYQDSEIATAYTNTIANEVTSTYTVTNTGTISVYARTIVAFQNNTADVASKVHLVYNTDADAVTMEEIANDVTIGGVKYRVVAFTYKVALAAGETSPISLKKFYLDKLTTQEDMAGIAIVDNQTNNDNYTVYALSQAVQADGFASADAALDEAFGDITTSDEAKVAGWFASLLP